MKIYKCEICGQVVVTLEDKNIVPNCCNTPMKELVAKEKEDNLQEKHVPKYLMHKNYICIRVGEVLHPSTNDHHIDWIAIKTSKGYYIQYLLPLDRPLASFNIKDNEYVEEIYSYCNLHSLWKSKVPKDEGSKSRKR